MVVVVEEVLVSPVSSDEQIIPMLRDVKGYVLGVRIKLEKFVFLYFLYQFVDRLSLED